MLKTSSGGQSGRSALVSLEKRLAGSDPDDSAVPGSVRKSVRFMLGGALVTAVLGKVFELSLHITPGYVALSLVVSGVTGVVSGWYPASRAAKLDPVVALRAE